MTLGGKVKKALLEREIEWRLAEYARHYSDAEAQDIQLSLFNRSWSRMTREIPFYRDLRRERGIPEAIDGWDDFLQFFPVMRRQDILRDGRAMTNTKRRPDFYRKTGGTTSTPLRLPAWSSELAYTRPDRWYARTWYGIRPDDRGFIIWGDQRALETGIKGLTERLRSDLLDKAAGDCRLDAFHIGDDKLRQGARKLLEHRPDYILAYSMSLDALARVNADLGGEFRSLGMKAVIGSSEGFPSPQSVDMIREMFGCPVTMEYGTVEAGLLAHMHPDRDYRVFWRNYFIEACEEGPGGGRVVRVTSLYERCFPLLRYEVGDEIALSDAGAQYGLRRFKDVEGRVSFCIQLKDGTKLHLGVLKSCVGYHEGIPTYQIVRGRDSLTLNLLCEGELPGQVEEYIRERLCRVHPLLAEVRIQAVDTLVHTAAGKVPVVVDEAGPGP